MLKIIKTILNNQIYAISLYCRTVAGTVVLFIIARYLSIYEFGLFSSYKNITTFCLMFANLGFHEYILISSKANIKEVKLKIALFLLNGVFITLLMIILSIPFKIESHILFFLTIIRTFFDATFFTLILPYFQASKNFNTIATINIFYAFCITLIAIISYIFKLSLCNFLILNIILGFINFINCSYLAKINYLLVFKYITKFIKMLDLSIFAYIGTTIACYIYAQIPSLYVALFCTKEQAALYFAALTIANIISLIISAQSQKMVPELIKASLNETKKILKRNLVFIISITFALFIFMLIFGKFLLLILYGKEYYTDAYPILLILMLGNIVLSEATIFGTYITATSNQKQKIPMQLKATIVAILSLFVFHKFGLISVALTYLVTTIYVAYLYTTFTFKFIKNISIKKEIA